QFGNVEGMRRLSACFPDDNSNAGVNGDAATQIGQAEVDDSVASVGGAEDGKERLVLVDGQQLAVAKRPVVRGKIKTEKPDFTKKRNSHTSIISFMGLERFRKAK